MIWEFFIFLLILNIIVYVILRAKYKRMNEQIIFEYNSKIEDLKKQYDEKIKMMKNVIRKEYEVELEKWKISVEKKIREDAIKRSTNVVRGRVAEQLAPIYAIEQLGLNPRDIRWIGAPIDYIVFDGLSDGNLKEIIILEVKSGKSKLSKRERQVKNIVEKGKVRWIELRI